MAWAIGASAHGAPPSGGPRGEICQAAYAQSEITLGLTVSATQGKGGEEENGFRVMYVGN